MAKSGSVWTRDAALVLALAVAASGSLVLASSRLMGNAPPCGPWVGCSMTIVSRAYRVAGVPLWAVPLATAPLALLVAVVLERRAATALLAAAAGTMLKGEWILYRFGWICPWCTLSTVGLGAAALLSWGVARARPPIFALGSALLILGLPLALFRPPDAPKKAPSIFPLEVESIEAIDRAKLTLSANVKEGVGVFLGDPRTAGARERVLPWARSRRDRVWRLLYRPVMADRSAAALAARPSTLRVSRRCVVSTAGPHRVFSTPSSSRETDLRRWGSSAVRRRFSTDPQTTFVTWRGLNRASIEFSPRGCFKSRRARKSGPKAVYAKADARPKPQGASRLGPLHHRPRRPSNPRTGGSRGRRAVDA